MKRFSVLIAMGVVALMANGASAASHSRHEAHLPKTPPAYAHGPVHENYPLSERYKHPYESESLGHQWFPNPDRVFTTGNYP
jgi:hypothetical protein